MPKPEPRVSKVFHNPTSGQVAIHYRTTENDGQDVIEHVLKSKDEPLPAFLEALGALSPEITELAELPVDYLDTVRGITLHRDAEDPETFTVTYCATKRITGSHSPIIINTPAVAPPDTEGERGQLIENVLAAARDYLAGKRAQHDLPLETPAAT